MFYNFYVLNLSLVNTNAFWRWQVNSFIYDISNNNYLSFLQFWFACWQQQNPTEADEESTAIQYLATAVDPSMDGAPVVDRQVTTDTDQLVDRSGIVAREVTGETDPTAFMLMETDNEETILCGTYINV